MTKQQDNMAKIISIMERAIREMKSGYFPEFLVFMYPRASEPGKVDHVCGYDATDVRKVKSLSDQLEGLIEQIQKSAVLRQMGVSEDEFVGVMEQLEKDLERMVGRAFDNLKKEPEIRDTKQAAAMLRDLIKQAGTREH